MDSAPLFRVVPLAYDIVRRARQTMTDQFGNRLRVFVNPTPGNPCRFTLRQSPPGEELLLMSYCPFSRRHPYAEVGPIFIRCHGEIGYEDIHRFPPEINPTTRAFRCYDEAEELIEARPGSADPESLVGKLFANPRVAFIHVRSLVYGCYAFKIERA